MTMTYGTLANDETDHAAGPAGEATTDAAIRAVVTRLSRSCPSGGSVIERAAILAEGSDADAIIRWILAQSGRPEAAPAPATAQGLHGPRRSGVGAEQHPPRYVLPAGALTGQQGV
jgi:hypothetical protein